MDKRQHEKFPDVRNIDAPYKDTAYSFASAIEIYKHMGGSDLEPGQMIFHEPTERSTVSHSPTFVPQGEVPVDENSASSRHDLEVYPTTSTVGVGWGDYSRFQHWQRHGRAIKPNMVPEKPFERELPPRVTFVSHTGGSSTTIRTDHEELRMPMGEPPETLHEKLHKKSNFAGPRKQPTRNSINPSTGSDANW